MICTPFIRQVRFIACAKKWGAKFMPVDTFIKEQLPDNEIMGLQTRKRPPMGKNGYKTPTPTDTIVSR